MLQADVQGCKAAHAQAHDMGSLDAEMVEDRDGVLHRMGLAIGVSVFRHVRGGIAAGVVGDATVAPREVAELSLPTQVVARELVDEEHGWPAPASS